jgi:FemAB family
MQEDRPMVEQLSRGPVCRPGAAVITVSSQPEAAKLREWDQFVDTVPGSDVAQLSAWARLRQVAGFQPLYVLAHLDGHLAGGALVLHRRLPVVGRFGYVSNGPLIAPDAPRELVVDPLVAALDRLARTQMGALFVQPPAGGQDVSVALRGRGFRPSTAGVAPAASVRVDLRRDTEDLRSAMTKGNRSRTRNWTSAGSP